MPATNQFRPGHGMKHFGPFQFDTQNECLWRDGVRLNIKPKPYSVLRYLVEHPQRLVTHDELLEALWAETYVQPQVLRTYVLELRKLLGDDAGRPRFIATIPKRGYHFLLPVTEALSPANESAETRPRLVGRNRELKVFGEALARAGRGERQVLFITGEAGAGKTALLEAFARDASARAMVAWGRCTEGLAGQEACGPVLECLRDLEKAFEGNMGAGSATVLLKRNEGNRNLFPWTPSEFCEAIERMSEHQPLLLVFEDVHWADTATLDLLSALARRRSRARLVLAMTCRAADHADSQLAMRRVRQDLISRHLASSVSLAPLVETDVAAYVAHRLAQLAPGTPPAEIAALVHQHSDGNPMFMVAMIDHLLSQKLVVPENGLWKSSAPLADVEIGIPQQLADLIGLQVLQRPAWEQRLLEAGAVAGVVFPVWSAAAALDLNPAEAEEQYEALAKQISFLHAGGHDELPDGTRSSFYVFSNRIYRDVLYQRQPAARRSLAHLRIAERLKELFADCETGISFELAAHFEAAGDWGRAADALCVSAHNAIERQSGADAAALLTRSLELLQNLPARQRSDREERIQQQIAGLAEALNVARV